MPCDDGAVNYREAAVLARRRINTVRGWVLLGKLKPVYRLRARLYFRPADVLAIAAAVEADPRGRGALKRHPSEPTAEAVERCVAEQMQRLPAWWWNDCARMNGQEFANDRRAEYEAQSRRAA